MIIKLFPTIITLLYVYNIIGITIFNTDTMNSDESIYNDFTYCNFTSFYEGLLLLF